jgi:hypothetical protein
MFTPHASFTIARLFGLMPNQNFGVPRADMAAVWFFTREVACQRKCGRTDQVSQRIFANTAASKTFAILSGKFSPLATSIWGGDW